jgi:signal transduction histidine kinase
VHRPRSRSFSWPLLLLLFSLSVMLGTAWKAHQLSRQQRQTAEQLLRDYAAFAAWSYQAQLANALQEVAWQVVNPVMHRNLHYSVRIPDAGDLVRYRSQSLRDCRCDSIPRPETYFGFVLGADTLGMAGTALSSAASTSVVRSLTSHLREGGDRPVGRMEVLGPFPAVPSLVAYGLMPTARMDTVVYGFVYDPASLAPTFADLLATGDLLPKAVSRGRPNQEMLALEVLDQSGELLYRDPNWPSGAWAAEEHLPDRAGGLVVRTTVRPETAGALVAGGFSRVQLPVLLGVVGLALLMAIVALVQLRRENQLARIRSEFVASVSHELRTPLAQIRLFLDTLRLGRYSTDDQRDWLLGHLVRETTRLEHLVDNVLQFSRRDHSAAGPLALERVELGAAIRETVESFAPLAHSRRVAVDMQLAEGLTVTLDPARFRQLLLNLLDNAVKFGPPGQHIEVVLEQVGDRARLRVTDQGPGVPEAEREAIWEPYFRGTSAERVAVGGSGIGLAIVRDAAASFGGRVWVEAPTGGGAVFLVELPLAAEGAVAVTTSGSGM